MLKAVMARGWRQNGGLNYSKITHIRLNVD